MIRPILAASAAALCLSLPALAESRSYEVGEFTAISVSSGIDLVFETGGATSISVENEKGKFGDIVVERQEETLVLKRPRRTGIGSWSQRPRYKVTATAPALEAISASSGADVTGTGLSGPNVSVEASSGADVTITGISAGGISLESSSGSDIDVSGTCESVEAESSSGSDIDARELICQSATADASSGSDISLYASVRVRADASSGGDVKVYGQPADAVMDKSSGGSVTLRD